MAKLKKSLSKYQHIRVLQVVGQGRIPLSSREIEVKIGGPNSDVYRIVKELAGMNNKNEMLFVWEEIDKNLNNGEYKRQLIKKLNHFYGLNLDVADKENSISGSKSEDYSIQNNQIIQFRKIPNVTSSKNEDLILVIHHSKQKLDIVFGINSKKGLMFVKNDDKNTHPKSKMRFELTVKKDDKTGKTNIYTKDYNTSPIKFLKFSLSKRQHKKIEKLQENKKLVPDLGQTFDHGFGYVFIPEITDQDEVIIEKIQEIYRNPRYYRYSLNIRGFLLYLLGPNVIHRSANIKIMRKSREIISHNETATNLRNISGVLKNLSNNYGHEFPFLLFYNDFQKVLGERFMVQLFKE